MPQRILVLGASGYIGQHLVRTLSQQGHQILAAARHVDRLAKLQLANVSCHTSITRDVSGEGVIEGFSALRPILSTSSM